MCAREKDKESELMTNGAGCFDFLPTLLF